MSDHDLFDDELATALRRRVGSPTDATAAVHDRVVRRAGVIRRRRAVLAGGGVTAVLVVGGLVLLPRGGADEIGPLDSVDSPSSVVTTGPAEPVDEADAAPPRVVELTIPGASAPTTSGEAPGSTSDVDDETTSATDRSTTSAPGAAPSSSSAAPSTTAASAGNAPTSSTATTSAPATSAPSTSAPSTSSASTSSAPAVAPFTRTYTSLGNSITVSWSGSAFTLQSVSPAAGFSAEIEDQAATRVRVRFRSDTDDTRIEVRVNDGELIETIG